MIRPKRKPPPNWFFPALVAAMTAGGVLLALLFAHA